MFALAKRLHLPDFAALFVTCIAAGVLTGALMNTINWLISPDYFGMFFGLLIPGWSRRSPPSGQSVFSMTVQHGCLEGAVFGFAVAVVFTAWVFIVSATSCPLRVSSLYLLKMMLVAFVFWFIGGFNGALLDALVPSLLPRVLQPDGIASYTVWDRCAFGWVGGSIWGSYLGAVFALVLGCSWFRRHWNRRHRLISIASNAR